MKRPTAASAAQYACRDRHSHHDAVSMFASLCRYFDRDLEVLRDQAVGSEASE